MGRSATIELRIRSGTSWQRIDWAGLWRYRDLLLLLVRRDFVSKYSQTILGPLWFALQPLVTTVLFVVVFSGVAKIPTDGSPPILFYLTGMLGWNYFANTFAASATTLTANAGLFGKVYFPRMIVPIATAVSNLFALVVHLLLLVGVFAIVCIVERESVILPEWNICALPLLIAQIAALSLGGGLWMSALTTKYRDFSHLSGFIVSVWFYLTPVIFPLSAVPEHLKMFAMLNPMTFVEEALRLVLLGNGIIEPFSAASSIGITFVLFWTGILAFQKCERTFIDTV